MGQVAEAGPELCMSRLAAGKGMHTWPRKKQVDIEIILEFPLCPASVPQIREQQFQGLQTFSGCANGET